MATLLTCSTGKSDTYYIELSQNGNYTMTTDKSRACRFKTSEKAQNVLNSLPKMLKKYLWELTVDEQPPELKTDLSTYDLNLYIGENKKEDVLNINNIIMNYQESIDDIINIVKFILNTYKQKTVELQALNNRNSLLDKELVDLDHLIEFNNLSASQGFQIYKIQQQKFQQRRYVKNLIFAYQQLLSLFDEEKSINALLSIKGLENQKYAPRTELYCDLLYSMKGVERCDE